MERLLKDAEELSGVKYDIDNLGDVYSAIHVIQEDLGLTGVAADEASTTFTGSFGAMKAAAENFMASLALGDGVTESLTTLITSAGTFLFNNLIPMLVNIVTSIPEALVGTVQTFLPQIQEMGWSILMELVKGINKDYSGLFKSGADTVNNFIKTIASKLPSILQNGKQILLSIVNGIMSNLPGLISSAGSIILTFSSTILSNLPTLLSNGWQMLKQLVQGIVSHLPEVGGAVLDIVAKFAATVLSNLPKILESGFKILTELLVGIVNAIPKIPGVIVQVISAIKEHFSGTDWAQLGRDLVQGIIDGVVNMASSLYNAIKNLIKNALGAGKDEAEVHSPSRKWRRELGKMLGEGMALGIEDSAKAVNKAVTDITSGAVATGRVEVSGMASVTSAGLTNVNANNSVDLLAALVTIANDINNTMEPKMNNALGSGVGLNISGREFGRLVRNYA